MSIEISHTRRIYGFQVKPNLTEFRVKEGLNARQAGQQLATKHGVECAAKDISRALINAGVNRGIIEVSKLNFTDLNQWITRREKDPSNSQKADENCLPAIAAEIGVFEDVFEEVPLEESAGAERKLVEELIKYFYESIVNAEKVTIITPVDQLTISKLAAIFLVAYRAGKLPIKILSAVFERIPDKDRKHLLKMMNEYEKAGLEKALGENKK